ncbi:MAG: chromosome segregation protein SMC, partial [Planctomycetota bacterium]|nr:chromosome segregation protein SMC [Planctomycetota bacterium]
MLKALEIVGFKSFADKTRFDFPAGITVVVGPNGSGKSNVVDAIKWVLGEQSAKSLRGKDMSDVIFKGAGSGNGRRPGNTAEATIVLDNSDGRLEYDSEEIHVTRRVFRSGEGEYLINGNACRLKDIKDLFRGTGIGTDAYSLIEQGKVDRLLQASPKDRRAIFEEAAGISRFKAKKVEAQRRLARVEQNLLRLSDIVEEVGSRYRSVKAQASKASKYKEHSDRLRQLRIELSFIDWKSSSESLSVFAAEEQDLAEKLSSSEAELGEGESELGQLQDQVNRFSDTLLELESQASKVREAIARLEHTSDSEGQRLHEIEERQLLVSDQLKELEAKVQSLTGSRSEFQAELESVNGKLAEQQKRFADIESQLSALEESLAADRQSESRLAEEQVALEKKWADQQRRSFELETEFNSLKKSSERTQGVLDGVTSEIQQVAVELSTVESAEKKLEDETAAKDDALAGAREELKQSQNRLAVLTEELQELKSEKSGTVQRAKVIEELEKRFDGVQSGAKHVLECSRSDPTGPFGDVHGLVADLIQMQVQHATLIDAILGEWSQFVVCDGAALSEWLKVNEPKIAGRVGIFRLDDLPKNGPVYNVDLSGRAGVVGRADQVVTGDSKFRELVGFLLGNVWIVHSIRDAFRIRSEVSKQIRYATLQGEMVEPDGSVVMGPPATEMSLISRRSELRSLRQKLLDLEVSIEKSTASVKKLSEQVSVWDSRVDQLLSEHTAVSKQLSQHQIERENLQKQLEVLKKSRDDTRDELERMTSKKDVV